MSFAYFYLHHAPDKNSHVKALYANFYGKTKSRKKSLGKENEKNQPREERKSSILSRKEKKKPLPGARKALGLAKRLRQSRHLLKIRSIQISLEQVA